MKLELKRSCGDCAKCCEGWLSANIYGHNMYRGRPCFFLEKTCTIYENRPHEPCQTYQCGWLQEPEMFPAWMKPSLVDVIVTKKYHKEDKNNFYYEIVECGKKIDSEVLNYLILWAFATKSNIVYQVDGRFHKLGDSKFTSDPASLPAPVPADAKLAPKEQKNAKK